MHGRNKQEFQSRSKAEIEALKSKVSKYKQLASISLDKRRTGKASLRPNHHPC